MHSGSSPQADGFVDFHSHLMPGVDDGARNRADSGEALRAFELDGVHVVTTTPHYDASAALRPESLAARLDAFDGAWNELLAVAAVAAPAIELHRGAEVKLDVPEPDLTDDRLRLAGTRYVLVEFPFFSVPPRSAHVLAFLRRSGWLPIVAHPERYMGLGRDPRVVSEWREVGALIQVNGGSLLGRYGVDPRRAAVALLERGLVDFLCSDYHARGAAHIRPYHDLLCSMDGDIQADLLMRANPLHVLRDEETEKVAPLKLRKGWWERIAAAFRMDRPGDE
jgi:protein-tyrosine phosphatase